MKKINIIILLVIISIMIPSAIATDNQSTNKSTTYRTLVDQYHGFYRVYQVYNNLLGISIDYQNNTLNISKGDTIVWINDAVPEEKLSIGSKEELWDWHNGTLLWSYKEFVYTFNKSGIYEVYIKEHINFRQKIIVGPIELNGNKNTATVSDAKPEITNIVSSNVTMKTNATNVATIKQNSTLNKSNIPISMSISDSLKSRFDTIMLVIVLLSTIVLSRRIKEN